MAESKDLSQYKVLLCGLDPICRSVVEEALSKDQIIDRAYDLTKLAEEIFDPAPILLIFGTPPEGINLAEVAQIARMRNPAQPIFYVTSQRPHFDRKNFQKNGFTDAFLLPIDTGTLLQEVKDQLAQITKGAIRSFRRVQLIDLRPNEKLDFDTFMFFPMNKKHIKITAEGDELDVEQLEKLKKAQVNSVHVTSNQIQKFFAFSGAKLRNLQGGAGISETERKERMKGAIRNLMASIFSDTTSDATLEGGRGIVTDCQQIVKNFITGGTEKNDWYEKMLQVTGAEAGSYNHAGNVATFGTLFSLAIGKGKPEDIALAGLLHDMGLADISPAVQIKSEKERSREEEEEYRKHVEHTLNVIKFRKMILPENVTKAIAQHHERWSGTGYPKGFAGARITIEAQLLALSDRFDYLTMTREGTIRMTPAAAFKCLYEENINNSAEAQFDVELLKEVMAIFPEEKIKTP